MNLGMIKTSLSSTLGIPPSCQILMYDGEVLDDGKHSLHHGVLHLALAFRTLASVSCSRAFVPSSTCVADNRFTDERVDAFAKKVLDLTVSSVSRPTQLGVGAGGSIMQHIELDKNDPRIWDVTNSKILNVQIVDSTTFRLVTGFNPPETPITAQTYEQMGLPFYRLWRDEGKEDGVAGVWSGLKGVAEVASMKDIPAVSAGSEKWGLLETGAWGPIGSAKESTEGEGRVGGEGGLKEQSFDFPIVLLDVDDTLPRFRSVAEPEESDDVWEDMYDV